MFCSVNLAIGTATNSEDTKLDLAGRRIGSDAGSLAKTESLAIVRVAVPCDLHQLIPKLPLDGRRAMNSLPRLSCRQSVLWVSLLWTNEVREFTSVCIGRSVTATSTVATMASKLQGASQSFRIPELN